MWFEVIDVKVVKVLMGLMSVDECDVGRDGCCGDSWEEGRKGWKMVGARCLSTSRKTSQSTISFRASHNNLA